MGPAFAQHPQAMRKVVTTNRLLLLALVTLAATALQAPSAVAFNLEGDDIQLKLILPDKDDNLNPNDYPNEEEVKKHFNLANCLCPEVKFGVEVSIPDRPTSYADSAPVALWVGSSCDQSPQNINVRYANCEELVDDGFGDVDDIKGLPVRAVSVRSLLAPKLEAGECPRRTGTQGVYAMIDGDTPGIVEPSNIEPGDYVAPILNINYDTKPPDPPAEISASEGDGAIQISWKASTSGDSTDIRYYQALCARVDGSTDDKFGGTPQYLTTQQACQLDLDGAHPGGPDAVDDPTLPTALKELNPKNLCGSTAGTSTSLRISDLENDVPYRVILLAVDYARNVTAVDLGEYTPIPSEDGWEHYKKAGGNADGGYCFIATATYGNYDHPFVRILRNFRDDTLAHFGLGRDFIAWYYATSPPLAAFIARHESARIVSYLLLAPLVAFAAVWEYTGPLSKLILLLAFVGLVHWRRSRKHRAQAASEPMPPGKRALIGATSILLLIAFSATAHAQPYWDELHEPVEMESAVPHWNVEVKAGPYYPAVDDEFSGDTAPFKEMFNSKWKVMGAVSVDRFLAFPMGQLGVTASLGYMSRGAATFELDANGRTFRNSKGELVRSKGDSNEFKLIPSSLGVVYRFTGLDDNFGIPLIPYGKVSLAYYVWWFTNSSGDIAESGTPSCPNPGMRGADCDGNMGRGGSLGYQGTIGLALRAERFDPSAETSLRTEMGIEHAGIFIEGTLAKVDGFGASDKLSVGDTTWFGGINFEF